MELTLVIPCYNEAQNLPLLIKRCADVVKSDDVHVLLVNNGSSDNSEQVMSELTRDNDCISFVTVEENQGYGYGILAGLRAAQGEVLAWTHADMQTDPADVLEGLEIFKQSSNPEQVFVKGRRYGRPIVDQFFTTGMSVFETLLMGGVLRDVNAQPTMFHRKLFEKFDNPPHDFSLDLYAYYMAKKNDAKVSRFPVRFGERAFGSSHWNVDFKSKVKFIKRTWQYSLTLKKELSKTQ